MEDLFYVKKFHTLVFGNEKLSNISDEG